MFASSTASEVTPPFVPSAFSASKPSDRLFVDTGMRQNCCDALKLIALSCFPNANVSVAAAAEKVSLVCNQRQHLMRTIDRKSGLRKLIFRVHIPDALDERPY